MVIAFEGSMRLKPLVRFSLRSEETQFPNVSGVSYATDVLVANLHHEGDKDFAFKIEQPRAMEALYSLSSVL
jgi:hypothetical protein